MALKKDLEELERKLKTIGVLSRKFSQDIDTSKFKDLEKSADEINAIYDSLLAKQKEFNSEVDVALVGLAEMGNQFGKMTQGTRRLNKSLSTFTSIQSKITDYLRGHIDLSQKDLEILKNKSKAEQDRLKDTLKVLASEKESISSKVSSLKSEIAQISKVSKQYKEKTRLLKQEENKLKNVNEKHKAANELLSEENATLTSLNASLDFASNHAKEVSKNLGLGGAAIESMGTALDKLGLGKLSEKLGLSDAQKDMKSLATQFTDDLQLQKDLEKQYKAKKKAQAPDMSSNQIAAGEGGKELKNLLEAKNAITAKNKGLSDSNKKYKVLSAGVKSLGKSLVSNLLDPMFLLTSTITFIVDAFKSLDAGAGDLAKNMNITYSEALNVREELTGMANASYDTSVNTKGLQEALMGVNSELGTNGMLSEETLVTMTKLNKQAGISMKTQSGLFKISANTGKTYKDTFQTFQASAKLESKRLGVAINTKQLMDEVANMSAATQMSIEGGVDGLARQAAQVKALGLSFSKLEGIADNLLQFETSIENELQAELLLGRNLNLEKARQLALNNDLAGVARELAAQGITSAKFADMNRIQQEAAAKAMGMNRDAMAEMLRDQDAMKAVGGSLNKEEMAAYEAAKKKHGAEKAAQMLKEGQLDQMVAQQSLAEKFNDSIVKLQEIFQTVVVALSPILEIFMSVLSVVGPIVGYVGKLITKLMPVLKIVLGIVAAFKTMKLLTVGMSKLNTFIGKQQAAILAFKNKQNAAAATQESIQSRILGKLGLQAASEAYQNNLKAGGNILTATRAAMEETILGKLIMQGVNIVKNLGKMILQTAQAGYRFIAESGIVSAIASQGLGMIKNLAIGALELAQRVAISIAAMATAAASTLGVGIAPILAALAAGAAVIYAMTADDMMSPGQGTPGYGQRTLLGPEGAIALNNKDTVIAGTNLFDSDSSPKEQSPIVQVSNSNQPTTQTNTNSEILTELKTANAQRSQGNSYLERDTSVSTIKVQ